METLVVALLSSSMFFDSMTRFDDAHIRMGFSNDSLKTKIVLCEAQGLTNFRFWYDDEDRPWLITRFKCSH